MHKVIFDHVKNHKVIVECKLLLEVLSFHVLSAWVKLKIVDIDIQGLSQG